MRYAILLFSSPALRPGIPVHAQVSERCVDLLDSPEGEFGDLIPEYFDGKRSVVPRFSAIES